LYVNGIQALIADGTYGRLVAIHGDMSHDQHGSMGPTGAERFLPWHRAFLRQLEAALQQRDAQAFIPYWNWADDRGVPAWLDGFLPQVPVPGRSQPILVRRSRGRHGRLPSAGEIDLLVRHPDLSYTTFTRELEGYHNDVHMWVGGTMANIMISPADPLFWLHHAQVDRLWSTWQGEPSNTGKAPNLAGQDAVLDPWDLDARQSSRSTRWATHTGRED
jgi:tyrosinase